mgnify:CR=1 FL=1|jgi:hypothetical protein
MAILKEVCKSCFGWREDITYYKDGKQYRYWKCMSCGEKEDGKVNTHVSEIETDTTLQDDDS